MVPALIYLLIKKLRKQDWEKAKKAFISRMPARPYRIAVFLVVLLITFAIAARSQSLNYKIVRKGKEIGWVTLNRATDSNYTTISFASEIRVSFLFNFSSSAKEVSEFRDGKLQHSYFYRKTNGTVKADRHMRLVGNSYEVEPGSDKKRLDIAPVTYNTLSMYFNEPADKTQVFSDNQQCFLPIKKEDDGSYTIIFPDGSTNSFYYSRGICYKVKIDLNFYSATLFLK